MKLVFRIKGEKSKIGYVFIVEFCFFFYRYVNEDLGEKNELFSYIVDFGLVFLFLFRIFVVSCIVVVGGLKILYIVIYIWNFCIW